MNTFDALTRDCFDRLIALRQAQREPHADWQIWQGSLRYDIDRMMSRAFAAGAPSRDVYAVCYALASLADAVATRGKSAFARGWATRPLHAHYFGGEFSQEDFFARLEDARLNNRLGVLHVYATCLALGYRGAVHAADADRALTSLQALLQPPRWVRLPAPVLARRHETGRVSPLWLPAAAVFVCLALYAVCSASIRTDTAAFANTVRAWVQPR
jgi:type IV/VI secretion system ImpK/VasF family protein